MRLFTPIALSLLTVSAFSFAAHPQERGERREGRREGREHKDEDETPLAKQMEVVRNGMRSLRRTLRDTASTAESLQTIAACEAAVLAAKLESPVKTGTLPEDERAAFVTAYRTEMVGLLAAFLDLEKGVLAGKGEEDLKALWEAVHDLEDPGHEKFTDGEGD